MKVIKQLKRETPQDKLRKFFLQISPLTKGIIAIEIVTSVILLMTYSSTAYSLLSLFSMRSTQIVFFLLIGLSDLKREQGKGSFYLITTFLFKNLSLLGCQILLTFVIADWPFLSFLSNTSIIIQYLFVIMVEDAFQKPQTIKYLFIEPFQLKSRFYPIFIFIILMVSSVRVDIIVPLFLGIVFHFCRLGQAFQWISKKIDSKFLGQNLLNMGLLKTGSQQRTLRPLDELATNDSIMLQDKQATH